jgi:hypothetical protein
MRGRGARERTQCQTSGGLLTEPAHVLRGQIRIGVVEQGLTVTNAVFGRTDAYSVGFTNPAPFVWDFSRMRRLMGSKAGYSTLLILRTL